MLRVVITRLAIVSGLVVLGCGAGPTNGGGAPNLNNTNRVGLPGGEINTRGGFSSNINMGGGPSFDKTNTKGLPGGSIDGDRGSSTESAKEPPPETASPDSADSGAVDL